jgi:ATP-dependent Clp protease protease subunit
MKKKWTEEALTKESKKYATRHEMRTQASGAYSAIIKLKLGNKLFAHMTTKHDYTTDSLKKAIKECGSRSEFKKKFSGKYKFCVSNGLLDTLMPIIKDPIKGKDCVGCGRIGAAEYTGTLCAACFVKTKEKRPIKKRQPSLAVQFNAGKGQASERKMPWNISKAEFALLRSKPCFYCGGSLPPSGSGLDRIILDKKIGYKIDNVVPCCGSCNSIKGDKLTVSEMLIAMHAVKEQRNIALDTLYTNGYHIDTRTVFIFGEINNEMASNVNRAIEIMEHINPHATIFVKIMSEGGNWWDGLSIYDKLKGSSCPIHVIGTGMVASTATAIFQAGDIREITPNTVFVLHDGTEGFEGEAKSFEAWAEVSKQSRQRLYGIYSDKSGKPTTFWQSLCLKDTILDANRIISFKLADFISNNPKKKIYEE